MRILMLGWEYPPVKSGGLGTACYGLTKEMAALGQDIIFVAPYAIVSDKSAHMDLIGLNKYKLKGDLSSVRERILSKLNLTDKMRKHVTYEFISSLLNPYFSEESYSSSFSKQMLELRRKLKGQNIMELTRELEQYEIEYDDTFSENSWKEIYGANLFQEVHEYALKAEHIALKYDFDMIVAHDWMTFEAAVRIKKLTGKPLCIHVHATEFDRTGMNMNPTIYALEKLGMDEADFIVANSYLTKENCVRYFNANPLKISAVHLAIDKEEVSHSHIEINKKPGEKIVLFLGRITMQKGPEYFLRAAAKALKFYPNIKFVMAGSGEKLVQMIEFAASLKISENVFFTGFLEGEDIKKILKMSDLFVLTSVSEPFGLVVLEAVKAGVPSIVSNTAGVAEILNHVLKVDFWDTNEMANQIVNVMKSDSLSTAMRENSLKETEEFTWNSTAKKTLLVYERVLKKFKEEKAYA